MGGQGPRVRLREFGATDCAALHRVYGDAETTRHLSFGPRSVDEVVRLIGAIEASARERPRTEYALAVQELVTGEVIGMARLALGEHSSGQIGFALRRDRWGRGLGAEAVELLLRLAFDDLGLHRVWGARAVGNVASARLMESLGMVEEGVVRGHVLAHGRWRDSTVHAVLEDEWRARRGADTP